MATANLLGFCSRRVEWLWFAFQMSRLLMISKGDFHYLLFDARIQKMYAMNLLISWFIFTAVQQQNSADSSIYIGTHCSWSCHASCRCKQNHNFFGCATNYKHETKRLFLTLSFVTAKEFLFAAKSYKKASFTFLLES